MKQERGFTGIWIPAHIVLNQELTIIEKLIYAYFASFSKGVCTHSNELIAERTGSSPATITRSIKSLSEKQFIAVEFVNGSNHKRRIYAIFDDPKKLEYLKTKKLLFNNRGDKKNDIPSNQNDEINNPSSQNEEISNQNEEMAFRGASNQIDYHRIKNNKEKGKDDLALADETPAKSPDNSWVDAVEERVQRSEIKAPAGYVVVDPNEEYTAKDLYGEKGDKKTAKTIADIKKQSWYTKYQKQEEVSPA